MQVLSISWLSDIEERDTKRALYATPDHVLFRQKKKQQKINLSTFFRIQRNFFFREIDSLSQLTLLLLIYLSKRFFFTNSCYYNKTQRKPKQKPLGIIVRQTIIIADRQYIKL